MLCYVVQNPSKSFELFSGQFNKTKPHLFYNKHEPTSYKAKKINLISLLFPTSIRFCYGRETLHLIDAFTESQSKTNCSY